MVRSVLIIVIGLAAVFIGVRTITTESFEVPDELTGDRIIFFEGTSAVAVGVLVLIIGIGLTIAGILLSVGLAEWPESPASNSN